MCLTSFGVTVAIFLWAITLNLIDRFNWPSERQFLSCIKFDIYAILYVSSFLII